MKELKLARNFGIIVLVALVGGVTYMVGNLVDGISTRSDNRQAYYELPIDSEELAVAINPNLVNPIEQYGSRVAGESISAVDDSEGGSIGGALTSVSTTDMSKTDLYEQINQLRAQQDLSQMNISELLEKSSQQKLEDMVINDYYNHAGFIDFIQDTQYDPRTTGELLAINIATEEDTISAWADSENVNETLFNKDFEEMGLSYSCDESIQNYDSTCVVVLHLAQPKN